MELNPKSFAKNTGYSLQERPVRHAATRSAFDRTRRSFAAAGTHRLAPEQVSSPSDFSQHTVTIKKDPRKDFLKGKSGIGGKGIRTLPKAAEVAIEKVRAAVASGEGKTSSGAMSPAEFKAATSGLSAREAEQRARCTLVRSLAGTKVRHIAPRKLKVGAGASRGGRAGAPEGPTSRRPNPPNTMFRVQYESGNLPIRAEHTSSGIKVGYKGKMDDFDYQFYLPVFATGLRELEEPYRSLAEVGTIDLIQLGGAKVLPVIPQLILPLREALNTRNPEVVLRVMYVIRELLACNEMVGRALVPYYRQLLPVLNIFVNKTVHVGDKFDHRCAKGKDLAAEAQKTLEELEMHGGDSAFINIKFMVPTYESCVLG